MAKGPAEPFCTEWQHADSIVAGASHLLGEFTAWLDDRFVLHRDAPWRGGHDEGSFAIAWLDYYSWTLDQRVPELLGTLLAKSSEWIASNHVHGYAPKQEAHHGIEHALLFLAPIHRRLGLDLAAIGLIDTAHHIGNWVDKVPPWYDWDRHRFRSCDIGSVHVGDEGLNIPEHLRFAAVAWEAHRITGERQYFDLATAYSREWAKAIANEERIPLVLDEGEAGDEAWMAARNRFMGAAPEDVDPPIHRVESLLASGAVHLFLDLHTETGDQTLLAATHRMLDLVVQELADPYADPAGDVLARYRRATGDSRYDEEAMVRIGSPATYRPARQILTVGYDWGPLFGLGKRRDMLRWTYVGEDHEEVDLHAVSERTPAANILAYEITGDERYAVRALTLAANRLRVARQALPDGRKNGCSAKSVSAVVHGHGRNFFAGSASPVLGSTVLESAWRKGLGATGEGRGPGHLSRMARGGDTP